MKKFYLSTVFFFAIFIAQAQIVNIPDPVFKYYLLHRIPIIDTNVDGQIQVSEALATTEIVMWNLHNVTDITGLEAFTNLTTLTFQFGGTSVDLSTFTHLTDLTIQNCNNLTSVNLFGLSSLESLKINECYVLPSVDLTSLTNLKNLELYYIVILDSINLSTLSNLETFKLYNISPDLHTIDLSALTHLKTLMFGALGLTLLDLSALIELEDAKIWNINNLTSFNFSGLNNLTTFDYSYNDNSIITNLDLTTLTNLQTVTCTGNNTLANLNLSNLSHLETANCNNNQLNSILLAGTPELKTLNCNSNQISTLIVTESLLEYLSCSNNQLTQLNVNPLSDLTYLDFSINQITEIDVTNFPNLTTLDTSSNPINTINILNNPLLRSLWCEYNNLSILDLSNQSQLIELRCSNNQLTSLELNNHIDLMTVRCGDNLFTTLDFSSNRLNRLYIGQNPDLYYINLKNGGTYNYLDLELPACPSLFYICADEDAVSDVQNSLTVAGNTNVQVNSYCDFTPGGAFNTIAGTQTFDAGNNGCDATDTHIPQIKIMINDGNQNGAVFTNNYGNYSFFTQSGNFILTPVFENPYFIISPNTATINFTSVDSTTQTQNFCIAPLGIHNDLEITLIHLLSARPGFDATYQLVYKNKGNQVLSGNVNFTFDDAVLDFVSSNPALTNQTLNNLNWSYTNLLPFENRTIDFTLNVNSPMETPAVNNGDILNFTASIDPITGDETVADNTFSLSQTVVSSYDPNDKTCLEGNMITPEMVGGYLHYMIRFQNSGTAAAENVVIKDMIDTTKFDMASLQLTSSSHPQVTKITGNKVEFQFQGINLPAEIDDAPGSNGYVAFKIKTKNNLVIGDSVSNKANIFFDYNFPIETNTATSTVALLGVNTFENNSVKVTPNPTKNIVQITSKGKITSVQLFDVQGRVLETLTTNEEQVDFDLSLKGSGIYFVKVYTVKGVKVEKVLKE